ncbi:MAG: GNAT family N-acetyltransferase [Ilumatobacter sp.]|jgi:[ribosomal protein S5]-alanine N-acetyltransferase|uniref:GNAT family N-acetyltransferase n=1 Tax=Ilumatobacter sp. TaxID=1967498 RepID=UPI00391871D3
MTAPDDKLRSVALRDTRAVDDLLPPDPPLTGQRVRLRPFRPDDAAAIVESCRSGDIMRYTMMPDDMTLDLAHAWIERSIEWWPRGLARFAVVTPSSDRCVGQIGAHIDPQHRRAEVFYWLDARVRGRGLVTEGLQLVVDWISNDDRIRRIQLVTHLDNEASHRVAQRCGFEREGVLRSWQPTKGDQQPDVVMWSLLPRRPARHP